jgi:Mn-dependent DtxR family transcriptional regulator
MDRLHQKGLISNPVGKAKSVVLTEDGEKRCRELFQKHFCGGKES